MSESEDLKALVAELRERAGQPGRYGLRSPDLQLLVQAADALEGRIAVPSGWQLVPVEPTREMLKAAMRALSDWRKTLNRDEAMMRSYQAHNRKFIASATPAEKHAIRYLAMLSAAPGDGGGDLGPSRESSPATCGALERAIRGLQSITTLEPNDKHFWLEVTRGLAWRTLDDVAAILSSQAQVDVDSSRDEHLTSTNDPTLMVNPAEGA